MRGKGVCLLLREHIKVIVVLLGNLKEKIGMGRGGGRGNGNGSSNERRGERKKGREVKGRGGGRGGREGKTGAKTEGRGEGEGALPPVNARVVPSQPGETQDQLEVGQREHLKGKEFSVMDMNTECTGVGVSERTSRWAAAIDEFNGDGVGKGRGVQMVQGQNRRVEERIRGTRVDKRTETHGRKAWHQEVHQKGEVTGNGVWEGRGEGKNTAQLGPH